MNRVVFLVLVGASMCFAASMTDSFLRELGSKEEDKKCAEKVGLDLENFRNSSDEVKSCFFACIGEERGTIVNDKIDGEKLAELFKEKYTFDFYMKRYEGQEVNREEKMKEWEKKCEEIRSTIKICAVEIGEDKDHCKLSSRMHKCKREKLGDRPIENKKE